MATTYTTIDCRICQGVRQANDKMCLGCGTFLAQAKAAKPRKRKPTCPKCNSHRSNEIDEYRYTCRDCGGVFECGDLGYFDDRPDKSLEKKERYEAQKRNMRRRA